MKVFPTGSQTYSLLGASSHASIERIFPFGSSIMCTATLGQANGALH